MDGVDLVNISLWLLRGLPLQLFMKQKKFIYYISVKALFLLCATL